MTEREERGAAEETLALLRAYFDAFSNLYGIVPLYRALRIIRKQNPELELSDEAFLAMTEVIREEDHYYIIAGQEEIYEDAPETPPMKREIITEYLYAVDDFESYEELRQEQEGKPFYIPEKEELLRYEDDFFVEKPKEFLSMEAFLRDTVRLKRAKEVAENLLDAAAMNERDPDFILQETQRVAREKRPLLGREREEFFRLYTDLHDHIRLRENRGFTNAEMRAKTGGGSAEPIGY